MTDTIFSSAVSQLLPVPLPRIVVGALERVLGIRRIANCYGSLQDMGADTPIAVRLLKYLEVTETISEKDLEHLPRRGPAVLVANHPFGLLEAAVLAKVLLNVRQDVKFLANGILASIPEVRDLLIPVDPLGGKGSARKNAAGIRKAIEYLGTGGLVVIFPAGEVSHFQWKDRSITDPPWNPAVARILDIAGRKAVGLSVVPVYIAGSNSLTFQLSGLLHPRLGTMLLGTELLNKRRANIDLRIGSPIAAGKLMAMASDQSRTAYLRWRTYLLASRQNYKPRTARPLKRNPSATAAPISDETPVEAMALEVAGLPESSRLARSGDLSVYLARSAEIPSVLTEIGRLREVTFRAAGEGTGKASDLDRFDYHYLHLFLWNERSQEIAGAYRFAGTDTVRALYTATLFKYGQDFLDRMGPALELGRSFVCLEYQKAFSPLLLLWRGIGKFLEANPRYEVLFGAVSISNQYHSVSRQLMVSFLERSASLKAWAGLIATRNPFRLRSKVAGAVAALDIDDLSSVVADLEPSRAGVPVLLRQYLKLGGKLLGFNVDPRFANALDGLILVDLTRTEPKLLERYLGKRAASHFIASPKGNRATL